MAQGNFWASGIAAGIYILHLRFLGEPQSIGQKVMVIAIMILAGIIEGSITGYFQWSILKRDFLKMKARNWLGFTALGAAVGWFLGMLTPVFFASENSSSTAIEFSPQWITLMAALMGIFLGALFGFCQWFELKKYILKASKWILANSLGWAAGLVIIFLGASLPSASTGLSVIILLGTISGLLAGLSVGAITGLFLIIFLTSDVTPT